ncbi:MAG: glycosyltransferase [Ignavibacteriaceae bacterium]
MDNNKIIVSILMPTYNRAGTIGLAIESVLRQNYELWELLIIDNQSTDNTKDIVEQYTVKDKRIKYFNVQKSKNPGISDYLNYGIKIAAGEFIARLDDDDEWCSEDKLSKQIEFLQSNKDYVLVGGGAVMVDGNRKEMYKFLKRETDSAIRNNALYANPFWHNTVVFRKQPVLEIGGYNNYRFVEDWDLWLRLGKRGKLYNIQDHLSLYMNAGQNLSVGNQRLAARTILGLIKKYRNEYPNYSKAFILNFMQYLFSLLPLFIRRRVQNFLFYIKRNYF